MEKTETPPVVQQPPAKTVVQLKPEMISMTETLIDEIDPKFSPIAKYGELRKKIPYGGIIDELNADAMVGKCQELMDKSNDYAKVCKAFHLEAKRKGGMVYNKVLSAMTGDAVEAKYIKEVKVGIAEQNEDVIKYQKLENTWGILSSYFETFHDDIKDRFYWFKRIFEYQKKMFGPNQTTN